MWGQQQSYVFCSAGWVRSRDHIHAKPVKCHQFHQHLYHQLPHHPPTIPHSPRLLPTSTTTPGVLEHGQHAKRNSQDGCDTMTVVPRQPQHLTWQPTRQHDHLGLKVCQKRWKTPREGGGGKEMGTRHGVQGTPICFFFFVFYWLLQQLQPCPLQNTKDTSTRAFPSCSVTPFGTFPPIKTHQTRCIYTVQGPVWRLDLYV